MYFLKLGILREVRYLNNISELLRHLKEVNLNNEQKKTLEGSLLIFCPRFQEFSSLFLARKTEKKVVHRPIISCRFRPKIIGFSCKSVEQRSTIVELLAKILKMQKK